MTSKQSKSLHDRLSKEGIMFPYYTSCSETWRTPPKSMGEVADLMKFSTAAATGMVDVMEKKGLVERYRLAPQVYVQGADRRIVSVKITPKGQKVLGQINATATNNSNEKI